MTKRKLAIGIISQDLLSGVEIDSEDFLKEVELITNNEEMKKCLLQWIKDIAKFKEGTFFELFNLNSNTAIEEVWQDTTSFRSSD